MKLELMRDKAAKFPDVEDPATYHSARVWHCKYRTLEALSRFTNIEQLIVATYPDETLEPLSQLTSLAHLEITHLPKVTSLAPLAKLKSLKKLTLSTLPGWDTSRKVTLVESLAPLAACPSLEDLELFGVVPESRTVDDLLKIKSLKRVRVSQYSKTEQERLRQRFEA
jgi:hypothetical protein